MTGVFLLFTKLYYLNIINHIYHGWFLGWLTSWWIGVLVGLLVGLLVLVGVSWFWCRATGYDAGLQKNEHVHTFPLQLSKQPAATLCSALIGLLKLPSQSEHSIWYQPPALTFPTCLKLAVARSTLHDVSNVV